MNLNSLNYISRADNLLMAFLLLSTSQSLSTAPLWHEIKKQTLILGMLYENQQTT